MWGYIDEKGSFLIKPVFEKAFPFVNGYAIIKFSDKYGVINRTAKYIYAPIYDDISTITTNGEYYYVFTKEGKKGISDDMFNFIIEHKKRQNCFLTLNIPPKGVIFSDFYFTFAIPLKFLLVLKCST